MKAYVVGLTGGLATGKTTVARMFGRLGAHVTDCDRLAHEALKRGTPTYRRIARKFRAECCNRRGEIVRRKLARLIFQNPKQRKGLEAIIHPYVFQRMGAILRRYPGRIHIMEVPLLFETGHDRRVDRTVVVTAPQTVQRARAARHLGIPRGEVAARIRSQWPLRRKEECADYVIRNDRSLTKTRAQVRAVWQNLLREAKTKSIVKIK